MHSSPSPPPPVDELFNELSEKNFLGHLKKNIVQRNVAEKKILASNLGMKKIRAQKNCPPPHQISNGPSLTNLLAITQYFSILLNLTPYISLLVSGCVRYIQLYNLRN